MIIESVQRIGGSVEAVWIDEEGERVRCHWYSSGQMAMLREDLGESAAQFEALISEVEAGG